MLKCIRDFSDNCFEELEDANKYIKKAIEWKDKDSSFSEHYLDLAKQEIAHFHIIKDMANKTVDKFDDEKVKYVCEWMCEKINEKFTEVNAKLSILR